MDNKETRSLPLPNDGEGRNVSGYAANFREYDMGSFRERIERSAFDNLDAYDIHALYNHDYDKVLARRNKGKGTLELTTDETGLKFGFELPDTATGNEVRTLVGRGDVDQASWAFTVKSEEWLDVRSEKPLRVIKEVGEIYDISLTPRGANPTTSVALRSLEAAKEQEPELAEPVIETKVEIKEDIINPICDEKVVFTLDTEEEVKEVNFEINEPIHQMDLVPTSEFLKNIDVQFEVVASNVVNEFEIITAQIREIEVIEPEFVKAEENDFNFSLNLFEDKVETESQIVFDLSEETKQMEVKDPVNVVPVTEFNENGIVKYSLEDYLEKEKELTASTKAEKVEEIVDEELNFSFKNLVNNTPTPSNSVNSNTNDASPLDMSIEDTLKLRADERKKKMKDFNYKFNNSASRIDEIEKEPAYKRMGIDLTEQPASNNNSRLSLGTDSNDDVQIRSNNSFLHDNVD